jgi:hypothetical protein
MIAAPIHEPAQPIAVVRERVLPTLRANSEFRDLTSDAQERLAHDLVVAAAAAARALAEQQTDRQRATAITVAPVVGTVEFPTFVST